MKIAYLGEAPVPMRAAHTVQVLQMAAAMGELGHDVTLFSPWHAERIRGDDQERALRSQFALRGPFRLRYLPYLQLRGRLQGSYHFVAVAAALATRPDVVFTRNTRMAMLAARAGLRVILESHMAPSAAHVARLRAHADRLHRWVFISDRLRAVFREAMPLPEARCLVEHDAVDLGRFTPRLGKEDARLLLRLPPDRPLVVYCGHLYGGRGVELLLESAAALPEVDFLLVGGHDHDVARIRPLAPPNVQLTGHRPVSALPAYLFAADVLVVPHTSATTVSDGRTRTADYASPMKVFEYMAAGRAIVATEFPSVIEVLHDGINGVVIPPDSAAAITDAIADLVSDPARATRLGQRARADVVPRTWTARAGRILRGL